MMPGDFCNDVKTLGLQVTAAFSDYSHSFTEAHQSGYPQAALSRPTISIRSRISGGISKNRCSPIAGRSRRVGKHSRMIKHAL